MLKKYRKTLILTSLITLLPIPLGLALGREIDALFLTPIIMLTGQWLCVWFTARDPKNGNQHPKTMTVVLWIIPVITNLMCVLDWAIVDGLEIDTVMLLSLLFGAMFLAVGNYLPKTKQNYTMGIKVSWAYTSTENWNATHRFGGKVWAGAGLAMLIGAFLPEKWAMGILIVAIFAAAIAPTVYSWRYYKMQKARGDHLEPFPKVSRGMGKWVAVFLAVTAVFLAVVLFGGDLRYEFGENALTVDATMYDDFALWYDDIDTFRYVEGNVPGSRTWGYGSFRLLMGTFHSEELGSYTRYTYYKPELCILITTKNGKTVVLSGKDAEETRAIYQELEAHMVNWLAG